MKLNLTKEQKRINSINKRKAYLYFVSIGQIPWDTDIQYDLHHIDDSWRHSDVERYIKWDINDVIPIPHGEHSRMHGTGRRHSEETKKKISEACRGKHYIFTEEHKRKISEGLTGYKQTPEHIENRKKAGGYKPNSGTWKKGHIPWNKGLRKDKETLK